jgi:hypothetical protein
MFAALDTFLASEGAQIIAMIIAGLIAALLFGTMLNLIFRMDERIGQVSWLAERCYEATYDHAERLDRSEEGVKSLSDRLSVLETELAARKQKAAEFKARIEKSAKAKA